VLYVNGELTAKDKNAAAMVGSRQTTHYGIETARKLRESTRLRRRDGGERRRIRARSRRRDGRSRFLAPASI
jgi:transcription initiation factor TFIIIB Brf1 subunit/transcription initiation factor TFIIB